jgi:hypothetical protein
VNLDSERSVAHCTLQNDCFHSDQLERSFLICPSAGNNASATGTKIFALTATVTASAREENSFLQKADCASRKRLASLYCDRSSKTMKG